MNTNELFAREKKAAKLVALLFSIGATSDHVLSATEEDWAVIAAKAGCKPPNPKNPKPTIDIVLSMLAREYAAQADDKSDAKWEDSQEYAGNRCPPRE